MKIISEKNVEKRQKMQLNLKKVRKKYNRSRSLKIISKNEFWGGKVEVDFWLLHSIKEYKYLAADKRFSWNQRPVRH